jgi:hypothetical protein
VVAPVFAIWWTFEARVWKKDFVPIRSTIYIDYGMDLVGISSRNSEDFLCSTLRPRSVMNEVE